MRKAIIIYILAFLPLHIVYAQDKQDSFKDYREKMLSGFQGFRKNIMDDYAKFLNGVWEDYTAFKGEKPYPLPKPKVQPKKKESEPAPKPKEVVPENVKPAEPTKPDKQNDPKPVVPNPSNMVSFDWCGMTLQLPNAKIQGALHGTDKESILAYFEELDNSLLCKEVLPQMATIATSSRFNDWCLFLLIQSYVKKIKSNTDANTRNITCWYIMVQFGFDVRLTLNGNNLFYLIPFQQKVFGRDYIIIHDTPYYLWGEGNPNSQLGLSTPKLPDDAGSYVNLVFLKPLDIPYKGKRFSHTFAGRTISGEVNEYLIKVMAQIPQIPIPLYAISAGDSKARNQVLSQMKQHISNMSEIEAANFMLQFVQSFDYATDDEQFGFEKPFFVEETLYYPKNDCEDRAIFYHFLVTNLLGNDVHLVHYPMHECNAVNFSQRLNADHYMYQGKQYVICDPTYIGATIGMCMPDFRNTKPEVELIK